MSVTSRVRLAAGIAGAALIATVAPAATAQQEQSQPSKITVAYKSWENNLTPFTLTMGGLPTSHDLNNLVYDTLFWSQVKEDPEPWLAERADPSPDRKSWTVKLRPDVKWHDGMPFTAEDVKFTFEKMKNTTGGRYSHHVWEYPVFESAEVIDPLNIRLNFRDAAPTFKILPGGDLPMVPKHIWEPIGNPVTSTSTPSIGTGPYKLVEFVNGQRYRLEANTEYFKGKPKVDQIDVPIVTDAAAAFAALQTGQVDTVDRTVPPELFDQLSNQPGIRVVQSTRMESVHLHFNNQKAPLNDPVLRKGITLAIDNQALVDTVLLGHGRPGRDGWTHPDSAWADPDGKHEFDVARANRQLDDAGYRRGEDGIRRTPAGQPLQFNITVAANEPQHQRSAQLISQQVEAIGVKMNVEAIDPATLRQRRGNLNYDSFITNLESHAHADPDALSFFFHSPVPNAPSAGSFGAYANPQFDQLVDSARRQIDNGERKRLLVEAQRIFAREAPTLVLFYPEGDYAFRPSAYNGWVADTGHGILTKRSFIPGYEDDRADAVNAGDSESSPPWAAIGVVLGLAVVGGGLFLASQNRKRESYEAEEA
jgi:peptide/nickel transport system substrate-binding protein